MPVKLKSRRLQKTTISKGNSKENLPSFRKKTINNRRLSQTKKNKIRENNSKKLKGGFLGKNPIEGEYWNNTYNYVSIFIDQQFKDKGKSRPEVTTNFNLYPPEGAGPNSGSFSTFTPNVVKKTGEGFKITKELDEDREDHEDHEELEDEFRGLFINAFLNSSFDVEDTDTIDTLFENYKSTFNPTNAKGIWSIIETAVGGDVTKLDFNKIPPELKNLKKIIFYQLCLAIKYCHLKNITYSDIKLDNVFLKFKLNDGKALTNKMLDPKTPIIALGDFGLSYTTLHNTRTAASGTAGYFSPEMLSSELVHSTNSTDIWSLGVIYYQIITKTTLDPFWFEKKEEGDVYDFPWGNPAEPGDVSGYLEQTDKFYKKLNMKIKNKPSIIDKETDIEILESCFQHHNERVNIDQLISLIEAKTEFSAPKTPDELKKYIIELKDGGYYELKT